MLLATATRGASQLPTQAEALVSGQLPRRGVDFARQGDGFLPDDQILVADDSVHAAASCRDHAGLWKVRAETALFAEKSLPL